VSAVAEEIALGKSVAAGLRHIGQIAIECLDDGSFMLVHRDDAARDDLAVYHATEDAAELARFDDAGNYRPLKTAPNLRHGWRLTLRGVAELRTALDLFHPGRLAAFFAFEKHELVTTPLRGTLGRQSGMYRIAAQIDDPAADELAGSFCRSDGGCLRTILWRRDAQGTVASTRLPAEKFNPTHDQTGGGKPVLPLLCQEACNLLVAEARKVVQAGR
jgi:sirohydrochlorin cobaltochelatase